MEWLLPAGAWALVSLLVIILLYLLRRKAKQQAVSSLLLWRRTESAQEASKPFQRLRKGWLLFLQLLIALLLSLALMRPALPGGVHGETVLILDVSASMQTQAGGVSRLEEAKQDAISLVDAMQEGDAVTILTAGSGVGQVAARSTDKQKLKATLRGLQAENGTADMAEALSLAEAMRRDVPELRVVTYTDSSMVQVGENVELRAVGIGADNRSVLSLQCSQREDGLLAFARIANYGADAEVSVECYADGVLCDIRTIPMGADEQQSVQFVVPMDAQGVWVNIATEDALLADNVRYWVQEEKRERRVLLVTDGNVFIEKALSLRDDVQVYKTTASEAVNMDGYDLYVLDGEMEGNLPQTGAILAFAPKREILGIMSQTVESSENQNDVIVDGTGTEYDADEKAGETGATNSTGRMRVQNSALAQSLAQNMLLDGLALRNQHPLVGGQSILTYGGDTILAASEQAGRRAVVVGFDLHDSNLPMKADFPILMRNLLDYLLPEAVGAVDAVSCGQPVDIVLDERTTTAQMMTPTGRMVPVSGSVFTDTGEIGVYALQEERMDTTQRTTFFTLHIPASENDVRQVAVSQGEAVAVSGRRAAGRELTVFVLLLALGLLLVEWEVSRRGA